MFANNNQQTLAPPVGMPRLGRDLNPELPVGTEPDYSRAALARFIEFVVDKNLVHPATAQGWRVATSKVLEELPEDAAADVRQLDVEGIFRTFLNRNPGRLSPASVGEYRRRVGRAIEEFVRWVEDPGAYGFRGAPRAPRRDGRPRPAANGAAAGPATSYGTPVARACIALAGHSRRYRPALPPAGRHAGAGHRAPRSHGGGGPADGSVPPHPRRGLQALARRRRLTASTLPIASRPASRCARRTRTSSTAPRPPAARPCGSGRSRDRTPDRA